jgi:hypothetical protein
MKEFGVNHGASGHDEMRFSAAKLFSHIKQNLKRDPTDETEWRFCFSHDDFEHLMSMAQHFADAFQEKLKVEQDAIFVNTTRSPMSETSAE